MICRVVIFQWKEGSKEAAERCADQIVKRIYEHEGVENVIFIGEYAKDTYGTAIIWKSEESADRAADAIRENALALSGGNVMGIVVEKQYDVYMPNE